MSSEKWRPFCLGLNVVNAYELLRNNADMMVEYAWGGTEVSEDCNRVNTLGLLFWQRNNTSTSNQKGHWISPT